MFRRHLPLLISFLSLLGMLLIVLALKNSPNVWLISSNNQKKLIHFVDKIRDLQYLPLLLCSSQLPQYNIAVNQKNLEQIFSQMETPVDLSGILILDRDYIPATLEINGQEYQAEISFHGEAYPHFSNKKKSYRVRLLNGATHQGMDVLNFILPEERGFLGQAVINYFAQSQQLPSLPSYFARLSINGRNQGAYYLTTKPNLAWLKIQDLSSQDLVFGDDHQSSGIAEQLIPLFQEHGEWKLHTDSLDSNPSVFESIEQFNQIHQLTDDEFHQAVANLFDLEELVRWHALTALFGDKHQDNNHNQRLLYLADQQKFQFIPNDLDIADFNHYPNYHYNDFIERVLSQPDLYFSRNRILWQWTNDQAIVDGLLEQLHNLDQQFRSAFYQDPLKSVSFSHYLRTTKQQIQDIIQNRETIKNLFGKSYLATVNKKVPTGITTIIRSNSYFQPQIKQLSLSFSRPLAFQSISLYFDRDENGLITGSDELIGIYQLNSEIEQDLILNVPLSSNRFKESIFDTPRPTAIGQLIIVAPQLDLATLIKLKWTFSHEFTQQELETEDRFINF